MAYRTAYDDTIRKLERYQRTGSEIDRQIYHDQIKRDAKSGKVVSAYIIGSFIAIGLCLLPFILTAVSFCFSSGFFEGIGSFLVATAFIWFPICCVIALLDIK